MEKVVREIIQGVSNTYGKDFFQTITKQLAKVIGADYTFIARLNIAKHTSETIALIAQGQLIDNIEYSLTDTPCADVADNRVCCYRDNVCSAFPKDQLLIDMAIEGYIGTPLHDANGDVMGLIVGLYSSPIVNEEQTKTLFQIFSGRIAAEIQRSEYEDELEKVNSSLEQKISERTQELSTTLSTLTAAQAQLIESEKMASLGNLVAGVAHEINTPLGVAITSFSVMEYHFKQLINKIDQEALTLKDMDDYRTAVSSALEIQQHNLIQAKNLIENFKRTAADQHHLDVEAVDIAEYYQQVLTTLNSILKPKNVTLHFDFEGDMACSTYPGMHAQILSNLITNSIAHGFKTKVCNSIQIKVESVGEYIEVEFSDNGVGISDTVKKHIFEPFYTTSRNSGGCGLGMSIVYNLITQKLKGDIKVLSADTGAHFMYRFKKNIAEQ